MAQISPSIFVGIAENWGTYYSTQNGLESAVYVLVDIVTTTYTPYGAASASAEDALRIQNELISSFTKAFDETEVFNELYAAVRKMLTWVIANYVDDNPSFINPDAQTILDDWINNQTDSNWATICPVGFRDLCLDAGYDTSNWIV